MPAACPIRAASFRPRSVDRERIARRVGLGARAAGNRGRGAPSHRHGRYHGVATCVDCHLPHSFLAKYLAKASHGWHHSKGFTLQDFHEPILIKPRNAAILQENCLRCHGDFVHDALVDPQRPGHPGDESQCVHCHRNVGHGARG